MRILLVTPSLPTAARGNAVTVERWRMHLAGRGLAVAKVTPDQLPAHAARGIFDVVHAHHAVHTGPAVLAALAARPARSGSAPPRLVVSLGGTDLHGGPDGGLDPSAVEVLRRAALILGPSALAGEWLRARCPDAAPFRVVRRGVAVPRAGAPPPDPPGLAGLVAGGIRPVKGQWEALDLAAALRARGLPVALRLVGPAVDADYAARLAARMEATGPDRWLGEAPPEAMHAHYASADFVLNTSRHEGAANAMLEGLAAGRPVAARAVPGNRALLDGAPPGAACLFDLEEAGVARLADWLAVLAREDVTARSRRGESARTFVRLHHDAADETDTLLSAYREAVVGPG